MAKKVTVTKVAAYDEDGKPTGLTAAEAVYELVRTLADVWGQLAPVDKRACVPIIRKAFAPFFANANAAESLSVSIPYRGPHGEIIGTINIANLTGDAAEVLSKDARSMVADLAADARDGAFNGAPR
jgi:DNA-binding IclR family transcriptional regulator